MPHRLFVAAVLLLIGISVAATAADLSPAPVPGGLGVNTHFTRQKPGELDEMAAAGIRIIRTDLNWAGTERTKGVYDFSSVDGLLKDLETHHIRAWFILDYSNPIYDKESPHTDEVRAAFAAWAVAAVKHFAGHDVVWEMWNEPNIGFWKPKPNVDDYAKLSLATGRAIHAIDPKAIYVGPGTSGVDLKFIEACFKAGCLDDWSAVSVHPYRQSGPEGAVKDYDALRKLIVKYANGRSIPILSGEWGYSVAWKNFDDQKQGNYLARQWLVNQWQQIPISIWYDWHDDGIDPKEGEHHFGIVRHDPSTEPSTTFDRKPSYNAARTLTTVLNGYSCLGRIKTDGANDYAILFANGDRRIIAVWTTDKSPHEIALPVSAGTFAVTSVAGESMPIATATEAGLTVTVGVGPIYISPSGANEKLATMPAERP